MQPFPVVEDLDVPKARSLHVGMGGVANIMDPLVLEAVEPAFGRGVVPAVALPVHRARQKTWLPAKLSFPRSAMAIFILTPP